MGLAILQYQPREKKFFFNLGSNRYYETFIGRKAFKRQAGLYLLASPKACSSLKKISDADNGQGSFDMPSLDLDGEYFIQLVSYRTEDKTGPLPSQIYKLPRSGSTRQGALGAALSVAKSYPADSDQTHNTTPQSYEPQSVAMEVTSIAMETNTDRVSFDYENMGTAMGLWDKIKSAVKKGVDVVKKADKVAQDSINAANTAITTVQSGIQRTEDLRTQVNETVDRTKATIEEGTQVAQKVVSDVTKASETLSSVSKKLTSGVIGNSIKKYSSKPKTQTISTAQSYSSGGGLSFAKTGAALTAITSDPDTLKTVVDGTTAIVTNENTGKNIESVGRAISDINTSSSDSVVKLMDSTTRSIKTVGNMVGIGMDPPDPVEFEGTEVDEKILMKHSDDFTQSQLQDDRQEYELEKEKIRLQKSKMQTELLQKIAEKDPKAAAEALAKITLSSSQSFLPPLYPASGSSYFSKHGVEFTPDTFASLQFADLSGRLFNGRLRNLFCKNNSILFPLRVNVRRPIPKAILRISLQGLDDFKVRRDKSYVLDNVYSGLLPVTPVFLRHELSSLKPASDYLVNVRIVWRNRRGEQKGIYASETITLVDDFIYDSIEGAEKTISLDDVSRYRGFWHKIWAGDFDNRNGGLGLNGNYYYVLEHQRERNALMETLTRRDPGDVASNQRLKSGMVISPRVLNQLLSHISSYPSLSRGELSALASPRFIKEFSQSARLQVEFPNYANRTPTLWVYPEVTLHRILLKEVEGVDENGSVTDLIRKRVYFPIPTAIRYAGTANVQGSIRHNYGTYGDPLRARGGNNYGAYRNREMITIDRMKVLFNRKAGLSPVSLIHKQEMRSYYQSKRYTR